MKSTRDTVGDFAIIISATLAIVLLLALAMLAATACEPQKEYSDCFDCTVVTIYEKFCDNPHTVTLKAEYEYCDQPNDFGETWSRQNTYADTTNHMTQIATCKQRLKDEPE